MKLITSILATLCAFFFPIKGILLAVGVAVAFDTITGVYKSVKLNGWMSIRSRRLSDVIGKILLYNTAVLTMFVMDKFLLDEFFKLWFSIDFLFTKVISAILFIIELTSIKENFEAAYGLNLWAILKALFSRGKEIKNEINDLTN
ncbi:phage holin family protein [Flavobacterium sp. RHBU_3]|uniref:phage holin family protein n=1 Tax=Flavobacterium sp. RHBU_3 TaxID=3391184 RepID=UPI003984D9B0